MGSRGWLLYTSRTRVGDGVGEREREGGRMSHEEAQSQRGRRKSNQSIKRLRAVAALARSSAPVRVQERVQVQKRA